MLLTFVKCDLPGSGRAHRIETGRHHSDDRVAGAVERDLAIENASIATVTALPESMAQDHYLVQPVYLVDQKGKLVGEANDTD